MPSLLENDVLMSADGIPGGVLHRVLWVLPSRNRVVLIDIAAKRAWPQWRTLASLEEQLAAGALLRCQQDPMPASVRQEADLTAAEARERDHRWAVVRALLEDPERLVLFPRRRASLLATAAAAANLPVDRVRDWVRLYWRHGQVRAALLPSFARRGASGQARSAGTAKRGRPRVGGEPSDAQGGINVTPEVALKLQAGARLFLLEGHPYPKAHLLTLRRFFSTRPGGPHGPAALPPPDELPTLGQFRYWARKVLTQEQVVRSVRGERVYVLENRPATGSTAGTATGPGAAFQIDAWIADIYLLSTLHPGFLVGRPVVHLVIDHYSTAIVGLNVALSGPGYEGMMCALESALVPKPDFCRRYGLDVPEEDWPCQACCDELVSDRGPEYTGRMIEGPAAGLCMRASMLPPRRPDLKGLVESRFRMLDREMVEWRPGGMHERADGHADHRLDATYTLQRFTQLMIRFVVNYNRTHAVAQPPPGVPTLDGRSPTPLDIWRHGVERVARPRIVDPALARACLMRRGLARETDQGLQFLRLRYDLPRGRSEGWFATLPGRKWRQREVAFDPRDMSRILLMLDKGQAFEEATLCGDSLKFAGLSLDEVNDYFARRLAGNRAATAERLREGMAFLDQVEELDKLAAADRSRLLGTKGRPRTDGVSATRTSELAETRRAEAWTREPPAPAAEPSRQGEPGYLAAPSRVARLLSAKQAPAKSPKEDKR